MDAGIPVANTQARAYTAPVPSIGARLSTTTVDEAQIGFTYYDLQTNGTMNNRLTKNSDGSFSAAWTYAKANTSTYADRGTGYNYYDPTNNWINGWFDPINGTGPGINTNLNRIEGTSYRTGFTNIVVTGSGAEVVIAHCTNAPITPTDTGVMLLARRPNKGTGTWTSSVTALASPGQAANNDTWSKACADGDVVHAVWQGSGVSGVAVQGQDGPIFYSRSQDGGQTWPVLRSIIPLIDSSNYRGFGGDSYSIHARNGTVAIAYGDLDTDVGLLKSTDGGNTWTKTIIQTFPFPFYQSGDTTDVDGDGIVDTVMSNSGDPHVMIDNNGQCHVWFSGVFVTDDGDGLGYFPSTDVLFYWNETMASDDYVEIATSLDYNGNGELDVPSGGTCDRPWGTYRGGLTQMPTAGIDANGVMYVTYASICEACDTNTFTSGATQARRHIYMITSPDGGQTWTYPFDIVPSIADGGAGEQQEAVFAAMARTVDNYAYVLYQRDTEPGHRLAAAGTCDLTNNSSAGSSDIIFARIEAATVGVNNPSTQDFTVSQNYPNPASDRTTISINLKNASSVVVEVTDIVGKSIYSERYNNLGAGKNTIDLNVSDWSAGVYNYSVITNEQKVTRQMIVR